MLKLGSALGDFKPGDKGSTSGVDPVALVAAGWSEIIGENNAANSRPSKLDGDTLVITTTSAARSETLAFNAELILAKLRARLPKAGIEKLRFVQGKVIAATTRTSASRRAAAGRATRPAEQAPSANADAALDRFRGAVTGAQRAKRELGWKECSGCPALVAPDAGPFCVPCANARNDERVRLVSRLLYEAPWLGFAGTAKLIEDLSADEYASIRHRLLAGWWDRLFRAKRGGKLSRDGSERMIASSYVLLKSERSPEQIDPALVRHVLGDELHAFIYGTEQEK
jgi:hypothetical protein